MIGGLIHEEPKSDGIFPTSQFTPELNWKQAIHHQYPFSEYLVAKSEEGLTPVAIQSNNKTQSVAKILKDVPGGCTLFMLRVYEDDVAISDEWTHVVVKKPAPINTRHPLPSNDDQPLYFSKARS